MGRSEDRNNGKREKGRMGKCENEIGTTRKSEYVKIGTRGIEKIRRWQYEQIEMHRSCQRCINTQMHSFRTPNFFYVKITKINILNICNKHNIHCTLIGSGCIFNDDKNEYTCNDLGNDYTNYYSESRILLEKLVKEFDITKEEVREIMEEFGFNVKMNNAVALN